MRFSRFNSFIFIFMSITINSCGQAIQDLLSSSAVIYFETSPSLELEENSETIFKITTSVSDNSDIKYSLTGGVDIKSFYISKTTGELAFTETPDYELPTDADGNNHYEVLITASNGSVSKDQLFDISVVNVNDNPPGFDQTSYHLLENVSEFQLSAGDPDLDNVTYSITAGIDQDNLIVEQHTGKLRFRSVPDFENPGSASASNYYNLQVTISDGVYEEAQDIEIIVHDSIDIINAKVGIKNIQFDWENIDDINYFQLMVKQISNMNFIPAGPQVTGNTVSHIISVHLHDWENVRYRVDACNQYGCSSSNEISLENSMLQAVGYIKASNNKPEIGNEADQSLLERLDFGFSLGLSDDGHTLIVGAKGDNSPATGINNYANQYNQCLLPNRPDCNLGSGAAYVFEQDPNGIWTQTAYIKNKLFTGSFGAKVSISADGTTIAISANDSSGTKGITDIQPDDCNNAAPRSCIPGAGAVVVFIKNDLGEWEEQAYIKANFPGSNEGFANEFDLSADGNTLVVGAYIEGSTDSGINANHIDDCGAGVETNCAAYSGAVYVFRRDSAGSWAEKFFIKATNSKKNSNFGSTISVSADGNTFVVGANGESSSATSINGNQAYDCDLMINCTTYLGAVYIFTFINNDWTQKAYLKPLQAIVGTEFGRSVSISDDGKRVLVGAIGDESAAIGINRNYLSDCGFAVEMNCDKFSGAAYLFELSSSDEWKQVAYFKPSNTSSTGSFGRSVTLSSDGNYVAVSGPGDSSSALGVNGSEISDCGAIIEENCESGSGAVYLFEYSNNEWNQIAYLKASNTNRGDALGTGGISSGALSISKFAETVAVGTRYEKSKYAGINAIKEDNSTERNGAVYLY